MTDALAESYRFCNALSRREAKNFYYSFLLLPPGLRRSMCALYAFLRHTDDLADEPGTIGAKRASLVGWRSGLDRALDGAPSLDWPGLPALADAVRRHAIPPRFLHAVIDGVEMDLEPRPFATFQDLHGYCYRVASAVGLCCIHIWGYDSEGGEAERLAESCGVALQLTNILRDVREDAQLGRVYLPMEDLDRFGVSPEELTATSPSDRLRELLAFQGERAYGFYGESGPLIRLVAPVGRPVLAAIVGIYRALLDEIARRDYDVLASRVALPAWRKAAITAGALAGRLSRPRPRPEGLTP
ncbi:phytoene/squalene synthase family protein [Tautonia plasticadhaerens]|uniref:All-trans-phytoene synthase n=1 Tax=Tautonia plasticadhaerens TaxID=2527974 RepID=A0A518H587_9BACT|nr:phytoene/squalene synthase family protein [Tautonia plasticadhaerens]QDV36004.1 All-trans-phytoene synthase [Tautonia plasticadhaerens]